MQQNQGWAPNLFSTSSLFFRLFVTLFLDERLPFFSALGDLMPGVQSRLPYRRVTSTQRCGGGLSRLSSTRLVQCFSSILTMVLHVHFFFNFVSYEIFNFDPILNIA